MKLKRAELVFFLFFFFASAIIWRLYNLQIRKGDYYEAQALGQQVSFEKVIPKRGEIFLNQGELPIAQTKTKYLLYISPQKMPDSLLEEQSEILSGILGITKDELASIMEKGKTTKREISEETKEKIENQDLKGVYLEEVYVRTYPQGDFASHVIGFVNEDGEGQYGIEHHYNEVLKGQEFVKEKERSLFSFLNFGDDFSSARSQSSGNSLWLTLDYNIQYFAEKLLAQAKQDWDMDSGQIIVAEPSTGKILALVEYPSFNPNNYGKENDLGVFLNASVQKLFEPGSVFKPITMAAGIEQGLVTPEMTYEDDGIVEVGGPPIYNFERRVWGEQSMIDVLEESINTGAVFVEQKLGDKTFFKYVEKFGFCEKTGIDLHGEVSSKNETLKNGYPRDFATASFGQGVELTSIQLMSAFSAIANEGKMMRPYVVERIIKPTGEYQEVQPKQQGQVISETTAAKLTAMLVSVVKNGSGRRTQIPGYYIAGKTGTAQVAKKTGGYYEDNTIHSFIGYFPALNPQALILVKLDNPKGIGSSGYTAVPIFQGLAKYIIDLKQIPPSPAYQAPAPQSQQVPATSTSPVR